jgi:GAF domain-containing protein
MIPQLRARAVPRYGPGVAEIDTILATLVDETGASRATLRRVVPDGDDFPIEHEALAPGAPSLREERTVDLRTQPVVREILRGRQVVQHDCRSAYDDPAFQRMLDVYGGLAAQIVTPIVRDGRLVGILSLHQLGNPRRWTDDDVATTTGAAARIGELL